MARKTGNRVVSKKWEEEKIERIPPLSPWNDKQKEYMRLIREKSTVIATGHAGTSKTYIPVRMACDALNLGSNNGGVDKLVISRPNISNSKSLGFMKGDLEEKFSYWIKPVLDIMRKALGDDVVKLHIEKGNIEFIPLEVIKGYSAEDCFFIVDEAEDISVDEAKKIITRPGRNCKLILAGDISQSELKGNSGLAKLIELVKKNPHLNTGLVDFNNFEEIVRGEDTRNWIKVFAKEKL